MELDSVDQYSELIEYSSDLITIIEDDGVIQFQSPSSERVLGYDPEELVGDTFFHHIHPDDQERVRDHFEGFDSSSGIVVGETEFRVQHENGSWIWLESIASNRPQSSLDGYVVNSRDVTEHKEKEAKLQQQANRLEAFSIAFPDLAFITNEDGLILDVIVGERSRELLYEDPSEFLDKTASDVLPEDIAREYTSGIRAAIETNQMQQLEYSLELPQGERWFEARIEALPFRIDGTDVAVAVSRDITERKTDQDRLATLTEELEVLNRVIRHDIRNDMAIIMGWAELVEDNVNEDGMDALHKIQASGEHIIELTEIARDYVTSLTEETELKTKPVSLRSMILTEVDLRREAYPGATFIIEDDVPEVEVVANDMLSSVFRNLLNNAVQHNESENPLVTVSCEVRENYFVIAVADNGPGIPDEQKESIFGKGEKSLDSPGTGIGLYLVRSLLTQYRGSVWVEDNDPAGSVFKVELQKAD